ncbi:hypothetical protein FrEUN1fDRAFT_7084 [Parafrankia sp. EUN1f]|nr:transposase [Parafrankia sp. EUN1f]EFC79809.1 hypothetical protein FrEUN1fDRAFT_7084 [Parafrankia sp. EUN1f]
MPARLVLTDAGYEGSAEFRQDLTDQNLVYVVGVTPTATVSAVRGCDRPFGSRPGGSRWLATRRSYPRRVSTLRDELHSLIDRLPESQVAPILALVRESAPAENGGDDWPLPDFVGALASGKGDLAARSAEILRAELGRNPE